MTVVNVVPGPVDHIGFVQQPTNTVALTTIAPPVTVAFMDQYNNVTDPSGVNNISLAIDNNPSGGALSGTTTAAEVNGVATFSDLSIDQVGVGYTLVATAAGLTNVVSQPFNITPPTKISGQKFNDLNGNGVKDPGEPGLQGWTIKLDIDNDGSVDATTSTDANGDYSFVNMPPGTHKLTEALQSGWTQTAPASGSHIVTVQTGDDLQNINFGNFKNVTISGRKFEDENGDGSGVGDSGLGGWTIFLDANNNGALDAGETNTTTAADGSYSFTDVGPGPHYVREVQQAGWTQTTPNPAPISPTSGADVTNVDFGNFHNISISGRKFEDENGEGDGTGDPGLSGWTIFLDANNNGALDTGEANTTTAADGSYSFTNLGPGTYRVREVNQAGWTQTTSNPADITATSGDNVANVDFGNFKLVTISGQKFNDLNGDGQKDTGEPGLPGWTIFLDANNNGALDAGEANTTTAADGSYSFTNLGPGTYRVREVNQSGWTQTTTNPADITTTSGDDVASVDFGNFHSISISGRKFEDENGDGSGTGDLGLGGWTIFLDANNNGALDAGEPNTTTAADGSYSFTNLGPGTYRVREVNQSGWTQTTTNPAAITATSGDNVANVDFGNFHNISISGRKFEDEHGEGSGAGDLGLGGWTIFLDANNNGALDAGETNTTTAADGSYSFTNLGPGTYRVREVNQSGWTQTTTNPAAITATSGDNVANVDFGNFHNISISGRKFEDEHGEGERRGRPRLRRLDHLPGRQQQRRPGRRRNQHHHGGRRLLQLYEPRSRHVSRARSQPIRLDANHSRSGGHHCDQRRQRRQC